MRPLMRVICSPRCAGLSPAALAGQRAIMEQTKRGYKMKRLIIILTSFVLFLSSVICAESTFDVKTSRPGDGFAIGIPKNWNEKVYASEKGTTYAYWDAVGHALTITVHKPNSFEKVLMLIKKDQFTENQLKELEHFVKRNAPLKQNIKLTIEVISNEKALVQSYLYRHETAGSAHFIKNKQFEFLKNGKQYRISFSPPPSKTEKSAENKFNDSYGTTFYPILVTFFLN
jgi:hypothetical protein